MEQRSSAQYLESLETSSFQLPDTIRTQLSIVESLSIVRKQFMSLTLNHVTESLPLKRSGKPLVHDLLVDWAQLARRKTRPKLRRPKL